MARRTCTSAARGRVGCCVCMSMHMQACLAERLRPPCCLFILCAGNWPGVRSCIFAFHEVSVSRLVVSHATVRHMHWRRSLHVVGLCAVCCHGATRPAVAGCTTCLPSIVAGVPGGDAAVLWPGCRALHCSWRWCVLWLYCLLGVSLLSVAVQLEMVQLLQMLACASS